MEQGMSVADVMALSRGSESGFSFGGIGGLILILLFFFIFGGNMWGGRNSETQLTNLERDVLNGRAETTQAVMQSQYNTLLGFKDAQAQMASCCCDIKSAIHADGEATRALITQNTIQDLRDQLNTAVTASANAVQTQNILNALGRFVTNPPYPWYNGTTIA